MSTTDPALAARERRERRPGGGRVAVLLVVQFVGGLLAGFGWAAFGIVMGSAGGDVGGWIVDGVAVDAAAEPPVAVLVAIPVGMVLAIVGSIGWTAVVLKRSDVGLAYGAAAVLGGGGIGALAATLPAVSTGSTLVTVIGVVLLVLAAAALVLGVAAARSRARSAATAAQIMAATDPVTATVSDQGYTHFGDSDRILTTVTFTFTDTTGVQRWVQRPMVVRAEAPLRTGDTTRLWYDRLAPSDTRRIVVEAALDPRRR